MSRTKSVLVDDMEHCIVCGSPYIEVHHVFFGAKRPIADKYGYVLPLCNKHHTGSAECPHKNRAIDLAYKCIAQKHFEANRGNRAMFIELFGKSYL